MILDTIKQLLSILAKKKKIAIIITIVWVIIVLSFGVFRGMKNRSRAIIINPDDYNIELKQNVGKLDEEYNTGQLLSVKNNLTLFEINQSKNYYEKRKKITGDK
jgi:capsular polysaccharide biosynthesis protein